MSLGIIIQARMGSKRLPGKVYKKILDKRLLEHVILRVKKAKLIKKVVVAIPDTKKNLVLLPIIKRNKAEFYLGDLENVLLRYIKAAEKFQIDPIIRITADCPLVDPLLIDESIKRYRKLPNKPDYFFVEGYPHGLGDIEFLSLKALKKSIQLTKNPWHLEHVMPFILEKPNLFDIKIVKAPSNFFRPKFRLCVDEKPDLVLARKIFNHFKPREYFTTKEIMKHLDKNPKLVEINKNVKQKP